MLLGMTFPELIGQGFGILAVLLGFISFQAETRKKLLLTQCAISIVFLVHYLLIGAYSGMALNCISLIRNSVYCRRNSKGKMGLFWPIFFAVVMAVVGVLTWEAWYSVFVLLGLVINTVCMAFPDAQKVRKSILVTSPLVLTYDAFVLSVGGIVYESVAILSSLIGILRNRKNK